MRRRYIGIEMGEHARTHCIPRLQKVIEGEQGGVSPGVEWTGGGGFRLCTLGDPAFDTDGRISEEVKFATIWEALTARDIRVNAFDPNSIGHILLRLWTPPRKKTA